MKKYRICSITMCTIVAIFLTCDFYNYMHAIFPAFNAYPVLPFNASPSYIRGVDRSCYSMERIFGMPEYTDICMPIITWVEHSPALDSLCVNSVTQYAWKKDSLLMEVSLQDGSRQWLLASSPSSFEYRCKLQEVEIQNLPSLSSYHRVSLANNHLSTFFDAIGLSFRTQLYIDYALAISYFLMLLSILVLNIVCLVLSVKYFKEINAEKVIYKKVLYLCTLIFPIIIFIIGRIITHLAFT